MTSATLNASTTANAATSQPTPAQGAQGSAGAGITGGYTGNSLSLQVIIGILLGLSLYNAIELIVLIFVTFQKYRGLYFWSLFFAGFGIIPYSVGFVIKFFRLLNPNENEGFVAVVLLTIGWYLIVTGQSVVLWSRLHLLTNSRRVLRYTLWMIIINVPLLHFPTTILTFASNSNNLSDSALTRFVNGYGIMEKIQMTGFFIQELILSVIYIKETLRLLKLSDALQEDIPSVTEEGILRHGNMRKTMYQLLAINAIIIAMDIALLSTEFANLYLIETTLKGVVYSIKLKLEFAVLSKLVQIVRTKNTNSSGLNHSSLERRLSPATNSPGLELEAKNTNGTVGTSSAVNARPSFSSGPSNGQTQLWPSFVDPSLVKGDVTHAPLSTIVSGKGVGQDEDGHLGMEREKRKRRQTRQSWIDEELDKHNIG
ncbi:hypothetical protein DM02DRAFT_645608 [Periconia macrospinosa]|uniref:DUF7703 domain-containing protein n=1 Tax=Periconia macrospinosa TaxID=97972 RepID=A0A2V1DAA1_9PLEO|nr:hypothetical protein DM02DRAFT_645608 [Periconia macrospinosa]